MIKIKNLTVKNFMRPRSPNQTWEVIGGDSGDVVVHSRDAVADQ